MTLEQVTEVEKTLQKLGQSLMDFSDNSFEATVNMTKYISKIYEELIGLIPMLKEQGVDLPIDILIAQLKNYNQAIENKDVMMLTDSINYEVLDTVSLYREILEQIS